ncbi:MAG: hypothetical protein QW470_07515 [Candidatus Caldarchaeum sp.]
MASRDTIIRGIVLFTGSFLVSLLVDNLAMDMRMWVQTRFGGVYGPLAAYYVVHYFVFQLTLIILVYGVLYGLRVERVHEISFIFVMTAGKLLGRLGYESFPSLYQSAFSIIISTQLSMTALLLGYKIHTTSSPRTKMDDVSMETYAGLTILMWFAVMPGVDLLRNDVYSNLLRIALALSLLAVSYVSLKPDRWVGSWLPRMFVLIVSCVAGLLLASLFSDILWGTRTLTALPLAENLYYIAAQALQGFFLSLAAASGIWLNLVLRRPQPQ